MKFTSKNRCTWFDNSSPKVKDKLHLSVMSEVNRQVMRLQTEMA